MDQREDSDTPGGEEEEQIRECEEDQDKQNSR